MKNEMKKKEGDSGDIDIMKNEIHRMQVNKLILQLNLLITRNINTGSANWNKK